ncbi:uncharacterized protein LOC135471311 isoform X2 [Liolophura sinensis]|uniref:uncharacterized protein LOC135471311 isoform X2 n=1 Tax=Liolophura sinensis TaxID=3198878 RepID=UPI0031592776
MNAVLTQRRDVSSPDTDPKSNGHSSTETITHGADVFVSSFHEYKEGYEKLTQNKLSRDLRRCLSRTVLPLVLITLMPNFVLILWYTAVQSDGNFTNIIRYLASQGVIDGLTEMWSSVRICSPLSVSLVLGYAVWGLVMMKFLPGKDVEGPLTPKGNTPVYKDNGFLYYVTTMMTFFALAFALKLTGYTPSVVYDSFGEILTTLNVFSLVFCIGLYLKGIYSPSSSDSGSTGNVIFDYYWGTELYPRILGFDVKVFTNCRFGMMVWALLVAIFAMKSFELHGIVDSMIVSSVLQLVYIKFLDRATMSCQGRVETLGSS